MWGVGGKSTTRRRSSNSRLSMGAQLCLYLSLRAEHWIERRKGHCSDAGLRGRSLFCCLLSQLGLYRLYSLGILAFSNEDLSKSPRHETCSSISVRKAQTAVKATRETALPDHSITYFSNPTLRGIHVKQTGNQRFPKARTGRRGFYARQAVVTPAVIPFLSLTQVVASTQASEWSDQARKRIIKEKRKSSFLAFLCWTLYGLPSLSISQF